MIIKQERDYELVNSMSGCGVDETSNLFKDRSHKEFPMTGEDQLVS